MPGLYFRDPADGQYKSLSMGGAIGSDVEVIISPLEPTDVNNELWVDTTKDTPPQDQSLLVPAGAIMAWAGAAAPTSWQLCNGTLLRRDEQPRLFAAIGVTYGIGDGVTTFATPNLVGKVIVASGGGFTLNSSGGAAAVTLTTNEMPNHSHVVKDKAGFEISAVNFTIPPAGSQGMYMRGSNQDPIAVATGGNLPHENMPPYLVLNYIIKL